MRLIKTHLLFLILALLTAKAYAQQTIQFSQYVFNGLAINPAYAGYKEDLTFNLSSRLQWIGISGAPQTATVSADGILTNHPNVGLGLIATVDKLGPESTTSIYANYAYRLQLDELDTKRLCFGVAFGASQYSVNGALFNAADPSDGSVPNILQSKLTPDFRFGVYYYSSSVYVGASVFNLLARPIDNLIDNTPIIQPARTVYITAGTLLPLSELIDVKPSVMVKEDFKGPANIDLTSYLVFNKIVWAGVSYRTGISIFNTANLQSGLQSADAVAAIAQFYVNDHFRIGYSFDFTTSKLANYQSGSHEISLSLSFPGKRPRIISPRYF